MVVTLPCSLDPPNSNEPNNAYGHSNVSREPTRYNLPLQSLHLTERSFDRMDVWPNVILKDCFPKAIFKKVLYPQLPNVVWLKYKAIIIVGGN